MPNDFHEGDMALELSEREYQSVPPLELLNLATREGVIGGRLPFSEVAEIARGAIEQKWLKLAQEQPERVRQLYRETIGEDGFPGVEEGDK